MRTVDVHHLEPRPRNQSAYEIGKYVDGSACSVMDQQRTRDAMQARFANRKPQQIVIWGHNEVKRINTPRHLAGIEVDDGSEVQGSGICIVLSRFTMQVPVRQGPQIP